MKRVAIILAAGVGNRFSTSVLKQFSNLNGKDLYLHSIEAFHEFDPELNIFLVLPEHKFGFIKWAERVLENLPEEIPITLVRGGVKRADSVNMALEYIEEESEVFIHDAARPCVSVDLIKKIHHEFEEKGNAVPYVKATDSIRIKQGDMVTSLDRDNVLNIQTPQVFKSKELKSAYETYFNNEALDDSEILSNSGIEINYVEGDRENIKVTYPFELEMAGVILSRRKNE